MTKLFDMKVGACFDAGSSDLLRGKTGVKLSVFTPKLMIAPEF